MIDEEHNRVVTMEAEGRLAIGIDRVFARKFYTDVPLARIASETGEKIYFEKALIWLLFLSVPFGFVGTTLFSVLAFRWWSFLVVPACAFAWFFYAAESTKGNTKAWFISLVLVVALAAVITRFVNLYVGLFFLTFASTLWITRLLYLLSTFLLRCFVVRNEKAFALLRNELIIKPI